MPEYQTGDCAEASVTTPVALSVPDVEATRRLREKTVQQLPPIFRFYPSAAQEAEADLRAALRKEHQVFLAAVQQCYRQPRLNQATVNHASFGQFLAWVRKQHRSFPNATNLARAWAMGEPVERLEKELAAKLGQAMQHYIQRSEAPDENAPSPEAISVFTAKANEAIPDLEVVEKRSRLVPRHELYTLAEAQTEIVKSFSEIEQPLANYLARFLKENCLYDPHLTERLQKKRAASLFALIHYEPGDVIVQTGQTIDATAKAALEALQDKRDAQQKKAAAAQLQAEKIESIKNSFTRFLALALAELGNVEPVQYALWIGALGLMLVLLLLIRSGRKGQPNAPAAAGNSPMAYTVILNPERNETIFLPVKPAPTAQLTAGAEPQPAKAAPSPKAQPPAPQVEKPAPAPADPFETAPEPVPETSWAERAREAEQRAEELLAMVRAGLAPHLAKQMMNRLVQELLVQRTSLLQTHQIAGKELEAIEARFTAIYQQLQEQLRYFETRTKALEGKLADKDQANSELLKAMIQTQKKLQSTQSGNAGS